jgi:uncharacterized membrane protein
VTSTDDVVHEARREAAPALALAILLLVVLAIVSVARDWELLDRVPGWSWLVLAVPELVLLLDLFVGTELVRSRRIALGALGVLVIFNSAGLFILVGGLTTTSAQDLGGAELLLSAFAILVTNVIVFAILYWELDDGGPVERRMNARATPDLQFPQDENRELARPGWRPSVWDYLYVSLTNSTAFSPTDAMPLTGRMKLLMGTESLVAITAVVLVTARAVNVLGA